MSNEMFILVASVHLPVTLNETVHFEYCTGSKSFWEGITQPELRNQGEGILSHFLNMHQYFF